ncbi:aspartyl-phosphate phosphatase Spo0E family protein [Paenibacillus sp. M-152]|uniref:aspartyl-phosphate phosphatase Spo0E family protein n=1 Tax=Paenibacillus sp. M-152 TaxID=2487928 RepID=UPI000F71604C|nr:aspartyl-phosphate phosphatase Spo0E family protein [Paenibacillus sp. M-152]AZH28648.1 aspartyl-phosphate phosphatase Spo0E family protein [Paenibacillus sp. M-152]
MSYVGYKSPSSIGYDISLEDEILFLRNEMMRTFQEEQSFTSALVIEISCKLDLKINEYMKLYGMECRV